MLIALVVTTVVAGAAAAGVAAARYRLAVEFTPALVILAVFASTAPLRVAGMDARVWPAVACLAASAVMLLTAGWAIRTRVAQLLPGWFRLLQRQLEADAESTWAED